MSRRLRRRQGARPAPPPAGGVRIGHLYPDYLNIYADRGNMAVFARRAAARGLELEVSAIGIGEPVRAGEHDLYYVGGGQDREQALIADDLAAKGEGLREGVAGGAAALAGASAAATNSSAASTATATAATSRAPACSRWRPTRASGG